MKQQQKSRTRSTKVLREILAIKQSEVHIYIFRPLHGISSMKSQHSYAVFDPPTSQRTQNDQTRLTFITFHSD